MARISAQSTVSRTQRIRSAISASMPSGITEAEISEALELGRRTINNYLRELLAQGVIQKDGLLWYSVEQTKLESLRQDFHSLVDKLFDYLEERKL